MILELIERLAGGGREGGGLIMLVGVGTFYAGLAVAARAIMGSAGRQGLTEEGQQRLRATSVFA